MHLLKICWYQIISMTFLFLATPQKCHPLGQGNPSKIFFFKQTWKSKGYSGHSKKAKQNHINLECEYYTEWSLTE